MPHGDHVLRAVWKQKWPRLPIGPRIFSQARLVPNYSLRSKSPLETHDRVLDPIPRASSSRVLQNTTSRNGSVRLSCNQCCPPGRISIRRHLHTFCPLVRIRTLFLMKLESAKMIEPTARSARVDFIGRYRCLRVRPRIRRLYARQILLTRNRDGRRVCASQCGRRVERVWTR